MKKNSINIPNMLSIIRRLLVPIFVASLIFMRDMGVFAYLVPAAVYGITAFTDFLDGKIARKYNLVTDFGKFIDPLADKFMVLSSMIALLLWMMLRGEKMQALVFLWVVLIVLFRELGVTSLRLVVAGKSGIVVAASLLGKIKTVSQIVGVLAIILEPLMYFPILTEHHLLSYVCMAVLSFTTIFSGLDYLKAYMPHIDSNK